MESTFSLNEIDEGGQSPIMAEAIASILSSKLDGLYAGEQLLTDNAATGRVMRLPEARTGGLNGKRATYPPCDQRSCAA
jgi:CRP-like cAMP-binding protein